MNSIAWLIATRKHCICGINGLQRVTRVLQAAHSTQKNSIQFSGLVGAPIRIIFGSESRVIFNVSAIKLRTKSGIRWRSIFNSVPRIQLMDTSDLSEWPMANWLLGHLLEVRWVSARVAAGSRYTIYIYKQFERNYLGGPNENEFYIPLYLPQLQHISHWLPFA